VKTVLAILAIWLLLSFPLAVLIGKAIKRQNEEPAESPSNDGA
jgi:hypothetical protein